MIFGYAGDGLENDRFLNIWSQPIVYSRSNVRDALFRLVFCNALVPKALHANRQGNGNNHTFYKL